MYDWWKKIQKFGGHRYYFMVLVIYAVKCDIPKRSKKRFIRTFEEVKLIEHSHELTEYDIESALEVYILHHNSQSMYRRKTGIKLKRIEISDHKNCI